MIVVRAMLKDFNVLLIGDMIFDMRSPTNHALTLP